MLVLQLHYFLLSVLGGVVEGEFLVRLAQWAIPGVIGCLEVSPRGGHSGLQVAPGLRELLRVFLLDVG